MDNKLDLQFFINASNAAKGSKGKSTPYTSFYAFRKFAASMNIALRHDWEEMEKEKAELRKTYVPKVVQEKGAALESVFNDAVKTKQAFLSDTLDRLTGNVERAYKKFAMIPPSAEKIQMIENAEKRIDSMSETEFIMLVENVSGNYQESALLHSIATKHGKGYNIPFEPEEAAKNLETLKKQLKEKVINNIGRDPVECLEMATFFRHEDGNTIYGQLNALSEYFDNLPIAIEEEKPIPALTDQKDLQDRLLKARQICWDKNAKALWEETITVNSEIQNKGLSEENITKAERIIRIVGELFPEAAGGEEKA